MLKSLKNRRQIDQRRLSSFINKLEQAGHVYPRVVLFSDISGEFISGYNAGEPILGLEFNNVAELNYMTSHPAEFIKQAEIEEIA